METSSDRRPPRIRSAELLDLNAFMELMRELNPEDPPVDKIAAERTWWAMLSHDKTHVLVVEFEGELVACLTLVLVPNLTRGARPWAVIENVVTRHEYRRRGIGTMLLKCACTVAWGYRCYKVMLQTGSPNPGKHRFYERAGFKAGERFAFIARPEK